MVPYKKFNTKETVKAKDPAASAQSPPLPNPGFIQLSKTVEEGE